MAAWLTRSSTNSKRSARPTADVLLARAAVSLLGAQARQPGESRTAYEERQAARVDAAVPFLPSAEVLRDTDREVTRMLVPVCRRCVTVASGVH
jgi:hypothetical protein